MIRRPPRSTRTDTLFPYTTLFRSRLKICRKYISVATSIHLTAASVVRSIPCSAQASPRLGLFLNLNQARRRCVSEDFRSINHGHEWRPRRRRADDGDEHDAVDRRHARSTHHVYHYHPDPDPCGDRKSTRLTSSHLCAFRMP